MDTKEAQVTVDGFQEWVRQAGNVVLKTGLRCLQVNVGYRCNLQCTHCHIEAGPERRECMDWTVMTDILRFMDIAKIPEVDITGGAPEVNPSLVPFIKELRQRDFISRILLRTNLAIYAEAQYRHLPEELYALGVELVASLPCYMPENVDRQRGQAVFKKSIGVLQKLNRLGFGTGAVGLHLVYNPGGADLPGPQAELEAAYKEQLHSAHGISFDQLYTITNMPLGRFATQLEAQGVLEAYMGLLKQNANTDNLTVMMCRDTLNVDWQGKLYDCDFNQALGVPIALADNYIGQISREDVINLPVQIGDHCFGCTAGAGSSCRGSLLSQTA